MTGQELRDTRKRARIQQGEVARAVGIQQARLCRIEKGLAPLSEEMAENVIKAIRRIELETIGARVGDTMEVTS